MNPPTTIHSAPAAMPMSATGWLQTLASRNARGVIRKTLKSATTSVATKPEALARLVGWKVMLQALALRMRCSQCGKKAAEVVAVARPRPRGAWENP